MPETPYNGRMHEYSIAMGLLRMVERHAREADAERVLAVEIRVGAQAGVELDLLRTAWETVRVRGPCAQAELVVRCVPVRWVCALCRTPVPDGGALRCAECDVAAVLEGGDELLLERIDLERA